MSGKAPLLAYFGIPKQTKILKSALNINKIKIQLSGITGSSFATTAGAVIRESKRPHLFIFRDKEEASYFINDIENLLKNDVFFFPASYRRAYQVEETDNANILLRAEVLNKLNNKRVNSELNSFVIQKIKKVLSKFLDKRLL